MTTIVASPASSQLQLPVPPGLSAEAAEKIAIAAQAEFATTAKAEGRRAALTVFNHRVSDYANRFTNRRQRRIAYTLGSMMDGETHSFRVSIDALRRKYLKLHPGAYVDKATGKPRMLSKSQMLRLVADLETYGVITVERERQDDNGDRPGAQMSNVYTFRFDRVIRDREVQAHDFTAADQRNHTKNDTRDDTRNATRDDTRNDTHTCSSSGSKTSSATSSSSTRDDDEAAAREIYQDQKELLGAGATARAAGGTSREDPSQADSQEAPASAAPPGGGAPAASGSRENRGGLEEWAASVIDELNEYMAEMFQPHINPSRKLTDQLIILAREHSTATVCQAINWWLDWHSKHKHVTELDNPAGFITNCLAGIVSDYIQARERQARTLPVEDRDGFDLYAWCEEQPERERQERAEREAQEEQDREAERVALENYDETRKAALAIAWELAELRGDSREDAKREVLSVYGRYHGNVYRIFKWFESELQQAKEMAAA